MDEIRGIWACLFNHSHHFLHGMGQKDCFCIRVRKVRTARAGARNHFHRHLYFRHPDPGEYLYFHVHVSDCHRLFNLSFRPRDNQGTGHPPASVPAADSDSGTTLPATHLPSPAQGVPGK